MSHSKYSAEGQQEKKENFDTEKKTSDVKTEEGKPEGQKEEESAKAKESEAKTSEEKKPEEGKTSEKADEKISEKAEEKAEEKKVSPEQEKIDDLTDRLKRQMAEFENFRKRTEKEKADMFDAGARSVLEKILPVVDNFERGLANAPAEGDAFGDGVRMIYKQMTKTLDDIGLEAIDAKGKTFDPNLHNAVMHVDDDQYGENEVVEELQKGYTFHDTVVRHSMVKVAN